MSLRREAALQLSGELGVPVRDITAEAHLSEPPAEVGRRLRVLLGVTVEEQRGWRDEWQAWRRWREAVEDAGLLVFQFPGVSLEQARGLSLLRFPLPGIGVNSKEQSAGARSFTLMHELAHIALAVGREERSAQFEEREESSWGAVERFAEEVASTILIPESALAESLADLRVRQDGWDVDAVRRLARPFRVTPLALATRLRVVGALTWAGYRRWRQEWEAYVKSLPPRRGGFASPVEKALSRGGRPFSQLVLQALDANRITAVDASRYLDLRFDHLERLRNELRRGPGERSPEAEAGE
jgi:Zn-dependent peptidase ImmA (M78 family)